MSCVPQAGGQRLRFAAGINGPSALVILVRGWKLGAFSAHAARLVHATSAAPATCRSVRTGGHGKLVARCGLGVVAHVESRLLLPLVALRLSVPAFSRTTVLCVAHAALHATAGVVRCPGSALRLAAATTVANGSHAAQMRTSHTGPHHCQIRTHVDDALWAPMPAAETARLLVVAVDLRRSLCGLQAPFRVGRRQLGFRGASQLPCRQ
jgi:hypothetical protein